MSTENNQQTISPETLSTEYLKPDECVFRNNDKGFIAAEIKGKDCQRVILTRAMPLTLPNEYIVISDVEKNELGIIENIGIFSEEQRNIINSELSKRYFSPVITEIKSVKEKFGHFYFDVMIGDRKKSFTVRDLTKNIRYHGEGFDLIDVDGNRFRIVDFDKIPAKSRRKLEPYIY